MRLKRIVCLLTLLCLLASALPAVENRAEAEPQYYITVDITNQIVTVYDNGNTSDSGIVRQMICSTGKDSTPTPTGTYTLPTKSSSSERKEWYYFSQYSCYAKWATRIVRGILFHSVLYTASKTGPTKSSVNALGSKASHGCIRLRVPDAQWIALNCPAGTKCKIYKSGATNSALRKKLLNKTFSRDSQTYDDYIGRDGGTSNAVATINLSSGKKGAQVTQLQNRLRALGFMSAAADGKFGSATKTAVNKFRAACGLKQTGKVDNSLWDKLFADDAPTSTIATLSKGWQGPAVKVLQQALADLKLYAGAVDGAFGDATVEAVEGYQRTFNLDVTGKANTALQNDAIAKAKDVKAQFGEAAYQLVTQTNEVSMAKVKVNNYTYLRSKANTKGKKLAKLKKNAKVEVLSDDGGKWVNVQYGDKVGFAQRRYLVFYTGTQTTANYEAVPEPSPEPTATPEVFIPEPTAESDEAVLAPALEIEEEATPEPTVEPEPTAEPTMEPAPEPVPEPIVEQAQDGEPAADPDDGQAPEPADQAEEPAAPTAGAPGYAVALAGGARLYAAPTTDAATVAELVEGEALAVEAVEGDWVAVRFAQGIAYAHAGTVALTNEAPAPVEAPEDEPGGEPAVVPGTEPEPSPEPVEDAGDGNGLTVEYEQPE